ncbi:Helicase, C-terminal,DEAD/DEAH box helicase domain,P-loop containing nucleoside triphosphate [Cinara cedri]|uniref:Helicase, C-terminal,DEAD/DEAH box helicase domain,P-loop containing nucleoside triphosphate n=1 Tax=Cinara cedri TaxID=506608 RepID=A0A5E4N455_9HEMI|nr:Helicase, C-terminal,DEAD/DEAH box helicase domain,P-loop containing nucleoside triphosphate [Cinara cedri]
MALHVIRLGLRRICSSGSPIQLRTQALCFLELRLTVANVSNNFQNGRCLSTTNDNVDKVIDLSYSDIEPVYIPIKKKSCDVQDEYDEKRLVDSDVVIKCKQKKLNHERNKKYDQFKEIPLASKGWKNKKAKGDYFTIHIYNDDYLPQSRKPQHMFENTGLSKSILNILKNRKITVPSQIQALGIPAILEGKNTLLAAETGCGKTLAYLTPIIQQILAHKEKVKLNNQFNSPLALVIVPGRELADQIGEVVQWFTEDLPLNVKVITGGHTKRLMTNPVFEENDIVVATIGAMSKLTNTGIYSMRYVRHVVLDEADTLMDDSFNELMTHFLKRFHFKSCSVRQSSNLTQLLLVSATMPTSLSEILADIIDIDSIHRITTDKLHTILPHVQQKFIKTNLGEKPSNLLLLAKKLSKSKTPTIIFCNKSSTCDWATMFLNENGIEAENLHGDMPYEIRVGKFKKYQNGIVDIMVSTDVGSRGLNTIRTKHIINYDFPYYIADYIHRCGRTGRLNAGTDGKVSNYICTDNEVNLVQKIELAARTMKSLPNVNGNITKIRRFHLLNELEKKVAKTE